MSKVFKKFSSGHEAITSYWRHYDLNFMWRRYPWSPWRMPVIFTARLSKTCLQTIICLFITSKTEWHISNTCTCFKKSKRGLSVMFWKPGRRLKLADPISFRIIAIGTNLFQYRTAWLWENNPAGLPQHVHHARIQEFASGGGGSRSDWQKKALTTLYLF